MKSLFFIFSLFLTTTAYASTEQHPTLVDGTYATDSGYCGFRVYQMDVDQIVLSPTTNPRTGENCTDAGKTTTYSWGGAKKRDGTAIDGYIHMCAGAQNHWCSLIEVVNSNTFIFHNSRESVSFYRW